MDDVLVVPEQFLLGDLWDFTETRDKAYGGDPDAQHKLGERFAGGRGVSKDIATAASWYGKSADGNSASGQFAYGRCLVEGVGTAKNLPAAAEQFQRAADQGHVQSMYVLGAMYHDGKGVPKNGEKALALYKQARDNGLKRADLDVAIAKLEPRSRSSRGWFPRWIRRSPADPAVTG